MRSAGMDWIALAGRILMSILFIQSGVMQALNPTGTMAYIGKLGLPMPGAAYALSLAIEIGVGLLFLIGFRARITALILAAWCMATAFVAHYRPGDTGLMIHFMKNVTMAGGFLQIVAYGAGRFSVDRR